MDEEYLNNIWQFSTSSKPYLQRFKDVIDSKMSNKWLEKFRIQSPNIKNDVEESVMYESQKPVIDETNYDQISGDIIDIISKLTTGSNPVVNFDIISEKCLENPNLYCVLAEKLPHGLTEKLCNYIFNSNVNTQFLERFYKLFLPIILKKDFSIDLLIKAYNLEEFKILLEIILKDEEIPVNTLQEFVKTLNSNDKTKFIVDLINIDIPNELFISNLFTIYLAYKDCNRSQEIQNYIYLKLAQIAENCELHKNYGRLLLLYIQSYKNNTETQSLINANDVERLVNLHRSPFKKVCLNSLYTVVNK